MRPKTIDIDVADASLTGFASNVSGAAFTITTNATTDGLAHQVSIRNDSATDHSGKTVTLVGTDETGAALTEVVTGPNNGATVESTGYFKTLTSATPSATIGVDTFDIGWVDEVISAPYVLDFQSPYAANIQVDVTGTIDFTVQQCFSNLLGGETANWSNITALASKTADTYSQAAVGATAIRVIVNSYSSGAELQVYITQPTNC